jgi:preprotein translocase subunit SecG
MYTLLVILSVIIAALLIIIVLLQSGKGEGLSGAIGGGVGNMGQMFGTRRTADFLSKATWWLGGSMLVLAILINLFFLPTSVDQQRESIIQSSQQQTIPTTPSLPPAQTQSDEGEQPQQQLPENE